MTDDGTSAAGTARERVEQAIEVLKEALNTGFWPAQFAAEGVEMDARGLEALTTLSNALAESEFESRDRGWELEKALDKLSESEKERERLRKAALPRVGARYIWEPNSAHARCEVVVDAVTWNGDEHWVSAHAEDGASYMNELDRWIEATVFLQPAPDSQEKR